MSLIFTDGFDIYDTAARLSTRGYTSTPSAIETTIVRTGSTGQAIRCIGNVQARRPLGSNMATVYTGVAWRTDTTTSTGIGVIGFFDGSTVQCTVGFNASTNRFFVARGSAGGTVLNTSTNTFSQNAWHFVECRAHVNASVGANQFLVYVNGVLEITVTTASDATSTANNYADVIQLGGASANNQYFDDWYISDSGLYLTNPRIVTVRPNGNGNESDFVGSDANSTDNYLLVDSTLYQVAEYTQSAVVDENDLYTMGNLPYTPDQIHAVTVCGLYARDASGARQARTLIRSGGANYEGSAIVLSETATYYSTIYETDPATAAAWGLAGVNDMETGITVEA